MVVVVVVVVVLLLISRHFKHKHVAAGLYLLSGTLVRHIAYTLDVFTLSTTSCKGHHNYDLYFTLNAASIFQEFSIKLCEGS